MEAASPEHDWQLGSPTRAYLRTSVVGADASPILYHGIVITLAYISHRKLVYVL